MSYRPILLLLLAACSSSATEDTPITLADARSALSVHVSVWESADGVPPFRTLVVEADAGALKGCAVLHAKVSVNGLLLTGTGGGHVDHSSYLGGTVTGATCLIARYTLDVHDQAELAAPITEVRLTDESATVVVRADNLFVKPSVAFASPTTTNLTVGETAYLTLAEAFADPARLRFAGEKDPAPLLDFTRAGDVVSFVVPADWHGAGNLFVEAPRDVYGHPTWPRRVLECTNAASCSVARYPATDPQALAPDTLAIVDDDPFVSATVEAP